MGNVSRSYIVVALQKSSTCWTWDECLIWRTPAPGGPWTNYIFFSYLFCVKFTISAAAMKPAASDDRRRRPTRQNGHVRCTFFCIFAGSFRNLMGDRVKFMPFPLATRAHSCYFHNIFRCRVARTLYTRDASDQPAAPNRARACRAQCRAINAGNLSHGHFACIEWT